MILANAMLAARDKQKFIEVSSSNLPVFHLKVEHK